MRDSDRPRERRTLEDSTAERLAAIVAAAESAAKKVIDDAEAEARRQLGDAEAEAAQIVADRVARLGAVAERLAAQAEAIRRHSEELIAELGRVQEELGADQGQAPPERRVVEPAGDSPDRRSHLTAVTVADEAPEPVAPAEAGAPSDTEAPELADDPRTPAGARLLATQMAVSGSSREEIELRLRNGFEIEDTASILDAILGPEGEAR